MFCGAYVNDAYGSLNDTLHFLNTSTPPNGLIETYETELHFTLNRRYHYSPDQVQVDLIRRNSFGERVKTNYNPLKADPDILLSASSVNFGISTILS